MSTSHELVLTCATYATVTRPAMGWLRLVGSLKLWVSFAEYRLFFRFLLQKKPVILRSLLLAATPYRTARSTLSTCESIVSKHQKRPTHMKRDPQMRPKYMKRNLQNESIVSRKCIGDVDAATACATVTRPGVAQHVLHCQHMNQ